MSMKRTRQKSYGGRRSDDGPALSLNKPAEPEKSWEEYVASQPEEAFVPYSLKTTFAKGALLNHAKFGKGVVIGVEDSRIDVLFADGKKKLGHGLT